MTCAVARRRSPGLRPWLVAVVLAGSGVARAEGEPAADSLVETVLRDLRELPHESLRSSPSVRDAAAAAIPPPPLPDAPAPKARTMTTREREEQLQKQKAARNWLLDGMQKNQPGRASADKATIDQPADSGSSSRWVAADSPERALHEPGRKPEPEEVPGEVLNPLDPFLAEWMTRSDFQLLRGSDSPKGSRTGGSSRWIDAPSPNLSLPTVPAGSARTGRVEPVEARPNPYLELLAPPPSASRPRSTSEPSRGMVPLPGSSAPSARSRMAPPPSRTEDAPRAPTQWKPPPTVDEKYFPQLKRF